MRGVGKMGLPIMALLVGHVAACSAESEPSTLSVTVTDSAGVTLLTHPADAVLDTLPAAPILTIGRVGEPDYEFFRIRQVSPLGSGNLVVANGGTSELLFYGPDGDYLRRVGQRGDGPSEFGFMSALYTGLADTLTVMDSRRRRLVRFDSAGVFVRGESFAEDLTSEGPEAMCVFPGLFGVLADGTRLTRGWGCMKFEGRDGVRPTMTTLELAAGVRRDTIGHFSTNLIWERSSAEPGPEAYDLLPLGPVISWALGAGLVYLSLGVDYEVRVFDAQGILVRVLREGATPPLVTPEERSLYREGRIAQEYPLGDDVPFPERFGGYSKLLVSHEGAVWARWAERPSDGGVQRWTIFSADGAERRRILLPKMNVHAVREGKLYGDVEDDFGVQTVVVFRVPG